MTCLALDKNVLFSGSDDCSIMVWDTHNNLLLTTLTGHTGRILSFKNIAMQDLLILEETGLLVSCAEDKKINIWNYQAKEVLKTIQKGDYFKTLDYINSLKILFGGNMNKNVYSFQIGEYLNKEEAKGGKAGEEEEEDDDELEDKSLALEEKEKNKEDELYELLKKDFDS